MIRLVLTGSSRVPGVLSQLQLVWAPVANSKESKLAACARGVAVPAVVPAHVVIIPAVALGAYGGGKQVWFVQHDMQGTRTLGH